MLLDNAGNRRAEVSKKPAPFTAPRNMDMSPAELKAKEKMGAARMQELEEMAARLLALARKLPPGQQRHDVVREIGRFRMRIAALKGLDLRRPRRGPKAKGK